MKEVDYILCEDTRTTRKLLDRYEIKTSTISYHQHSGGGKIDQIVRWLAEGKNLALVSDTGTPGISDREQHSRPLLERNLAKRLRLKVFRVLPLLSPLYRSLVGQSTVFLF